MAGSDGLVYEPTGGATSSGLVYAPGASTTAVPWSAGVVHNNPNLYTGTYVTSTTTAATWTLHDPRVDELQKTISRLLKRVEWLEAQPGLKDNPPPIGLIEGED